jgi:hypothetical protein
VQALFFAGLLPARRGRRGRRLRAGSPTLRVVSTTTRRSVVLGRLRLRRGLMHPCRILAEVGLAGRWRAQQFPVWGPGVVRSGS